jgi:hypothetical protein
MIPSVQHVDSIYSFIQCFNWALAFIFIIPLVTGIYSFVIILKNGLMSRLSDFTLLHLDKKIIYRRWLLILIWVISLVTYLYSKSISNNLIDISILEAYYSHSIISILIVLLLIFFAGWNIKSGIDTIKATKEIVSNFKAPYKIPLFWINQKIERLTRKISRSRIGKIWSRNPWLRKLTNYGTVILRRYPPVLIVFVTARGVIWLNDYFSKWIKSSFGQQLTSFLIISVIQIILRVTVVVAAMYVVTDRLVFW